MNRPLRFTILAASLTLALHLSAADTPSAQPAAAVPKDVAKAPAAAPAAAPAPTPRVTPTPQLPHALEGVITQDEYVTFVKFQQVLREDPEVKELSVQIRQKMNEMLELQKKSQVAQQKAIDANPEIKAIADKIKKGKAKAIAASAVPTHPPATATVKAPEAAPTQPSK